MRTHNNKVLILILYFAIKIQFLYGQLSSQTYQSNESGNNINHAACNSIEFLPGYYYKAENSYSINKSMFSYIDPNMLCDADYISNSYTPQAITSIDKSLEVGSTVGSFDVSPGGAGTYNIPILLPPGTNSFIPQLSVVYNSQASNGQMGIGWNIAGSVISSVTRVPHSLYYDQSVSPVVLSISDCYSLDGARLILISTNGGDAYYKLENENYSTIVAHGQVGASPDNWTVETKDGLTYSYIAGNSTTNSNAFFWLLQSIQDCNGNYILVNYQIDNANGEYRIANIKFTGNNIAGFDPPNEIKFIYQDRIDVQDFIVAGYSLKQSKLLSEIQIYAEGNFSKKYQFDYYYDTRTGSHLSQINEINAEGKKYNPIKIGWSKSENSTYVDPNLNSGENATTYLAAFSNTSSTYPDIELVGDYNGDGFSDLFLYNSISWRLFLNQGGTFSSTPDIAKNWTQVIQKTLKKYSGGRADISTGDVTGDGKDDIIVYYTNAHADLYFALYLNAANDDFNPTSDFEPPAGDPADPHNGHYELTGDFDGDGSTDLFIYYYDFDTWYIYSFSTGYIYGFGGSAWDWGDSHLSFLTVNFDGDSKNEIMFTYDDHYYVLGLSGNTLVTLSTGGFPNYCEGDSHSIYPGDFNGDGRTDLLMYDACSFGWLMSYSKKTATNDIQFIDFGSAPFSADVINGGPPPYTTDDPVNTNEFEYVLADFNGDSKTDIGLYCRSIETSVGVFEKYVKIYYSIGNNSFYEEPKINLDINFSEGINSLLIGDYNGDGHSDILNSERGNYTYHHLIYFLSSGNNGALCPISNYNKVTSVTDGFNKTIYLDYGTISTMKKFGAYENETYNYWNAPNFQKPVSVISSIKSPDGIGGYSKTSYSYKGARYQTIGKGFLGFSKISSENDVTHFSNENEFAFDDYYYFYYPSVNKVFYSGSLYSKNTQEYFIEQIDAVRYKMKLTKSKSDDLISGSIIENKDIAYDIYGNVTHQLTENNTDLLITELNNTYVIGCTSIPSRIETSTTTITRKNQNPVTNVSHFEYDQFGNLTHEYKNYQSPTNQIHLAYTYTTTGSCSTKTVLASGITNPKIYSYEYDPYFRFVIKEHNPLNQITEISYDPRWGTPITIKGVDGLTTRNFYNGFGQRAKTITPDNISATSEFLWVQSGFTAGDDHLSINSYVLYSLKNKMDGAPTQISYFDFLGRNIETESEGFSGNVYKQKSFFANGNVKSETENYSNGSNPILITNYTYQASPNRPTDLALIEITDGGNTNSTVLDYTFSNGSTTLKTTDPSGKTSFKTVDAIGKITSVTDIGNGTINYEYNSNNLPIQITVNGVLSNTMTYNDFGLQTSLWDRDAGTISYEYNSFGQVTKQTDNNGTITTLLYDQIDRLVEKHISNSNLGNYSYNYNFVTSGNGLNKIGHSQVSGPEGIISNDYQYDYLNRVSLYTETNAGQTLTTGYEYDKFSNVIKTNYPGGFSTLNEYTSIGYMTKIKNSVDNSLIWQADETNASGQFTKYSLGNGKQTELTYNSFHMPAKIFASGVQDLNMDFKIQNGNLRYRLDNFNGRNLNEEFTYDNLNRLISSQVISPIALNVISVNYDPTYGRIIDKTDAGIYTDYYANKPDAVQNIYAPLDISHETQNISYTPFNKLKSINENNFILNIKYGPDDERRKSELFDHGSLVESKIFYPGYEKQITSTGAKEIYYIQSPTGLCAMYVVENGISQMYYVYSDHLGSILKLTDANGVIVAEQNFDAWGRNRNPNNWTFSNIPVVPECLYRGFTGHEHLPQFALINMNGRCYDPIIGMMLSPDNYVADATSSVAFNRYAYCLNNPLTFIDPDGNNPLLIPIIIGAAFGGFEGYKMGEARGASGLGLLGYTLGGAAIGGAAAYAGATIATSGIAFANTTAITYGSIANSLGMNILSGGLTPISVSFGFGSYDFNSGEFGYLSKPGNSGWENFAYGLGALGNVADIYAFAKGAYGSNVKEQMNLVTKNDLVGHAAITDAKGNNIVSVGPNPQYRLHGNIELLTKDTPGINNWYNHLDDKGFEALTVSKIRLTNVNTDLVRSFATKNLIGFDYKVMGSCGYSCVSATSKALLQGGVLNMPFLRHPVLLQLQILLEKNSFLSGFIK